MFDHWEVDVFTLACAIFVGVGAAIRSGYFRGGVQRTYFNRRLPDSQRNAIFVLLPFGLGVLLVVAGASAYAVAGDPDGPSPPPADPVASISMLLGLLLVAASIWWMFRLPRWAKPEWVREYERAERAGEPVPDLSPRPMSQRAYQLNWLGLAALAVVWLAVHLPVAPLLIGLGLGMSALLASRPHQQP